MNSKIGNYFLLFIFTLLTANLSMPVVAMDGDGGKISSSKEFPTQSQSSAKIKRVKAKSEAENEDVADLPPRDAQKVDSKKLRRSNRGSRNLIPPTDAEILDKEYLEFLNKIDGFKVDRDFHLYHNPFSALIDIKQRYSDLVFREDLPNELPPGNYAEESVIPFTIRKFNDEVRYPLEPQGWKIHISAQPQSARKIAALVLAVIDNEIDKFTNRYNQKYNRTYFKIVSSIEAMRTMYYILGNFKGSGRETQAGKFMTIYPVNKKHAKILIRNIDNVLYMAKLGGMLSDSDFYPPLGEALVGKSGGVSVRYGNLSSTRDIIRLTNYISAEARQIQMQPKKQKGKVITNTALIASDSAVSFYEPTDKIIDDDRYHPWPEHFHFGSWASAKDPFQGYDLRWIVPGTSRVIRWNDTRNLTWREIEELTIY